MTTGSRGLREAVIRALAKVGLVWALAVLGALFMVMGAEGQLDDGAYALRSAPEHASSAVAASAAAAHSATGDGASGETGRPPHAAGRVLALVAILGGVAVLAVGAARGDRPGRPAQRRRGSAQPEDVRPAQDLPLVLALGLLP